MGVEVLLSGWRGRFLEECVCVEGGPAAVAGGEVDAGGGGKPPFFFLALLAPPILV